MNALQKLNKFPSGAHNLSNSILCKKKPVFLLNYILPYIEEMLKFLHTIIAKTARILMKIWKYFCCWRRITAKTSLVRRLWRHDTDCPASSKSPHVTLQVIIGVRRQSLFWYLLISEKEDVRILRSSMWVLKNNL